MPTTNIANGSSNPSNPECIQSGRAASLERARYFARQLLTADDLTADQQHVLARFRRHNRLLHGWGVVCGAGVRAVPTKEWTVVVEPGYLLGPQGDEILIDTCTEVDLSRQGLDGNAASACVDPVDPWCSSVRVDRRVGQRLFIAAAYAECPTRPVRVQPAGCGCDDAGCEYSRLRDGFILRVLTSLPDSYANMAPSVDPRLCPVGGVRACPDCVNDPWVLLAAVTIRASQISDNDIDNVTYRRHVISFASTYVLCGPKLLALVLDPAAVVAGGASTGTVTIDRPAPQGDSFILLTNSDPTSATVPESVTVAAGKTTATFPVTTTAAGPGGTVTIGGTLLGDTKTATLQIVMLRALSIDPEFAPAGTQFKGTVAVTAPFPSALTIPLLSDNPQVVGTLPPVTIPAGSTSASFPVPTTKTPGRATITATLAGASRSDQLGTYALSRLAVTPGKTLAGQTINGAVTLTGTVPPGGVSVALASTNTSVLNNLPLPLNVADVPAEVQVPGGDNPTATFQLTANRGGVAHIVGTLGTQSAAADLAVVGLRSFTLESNSVQLGSTVKGTLTLSEPAPGVDALVSMSTVAGAVDMPAGVKIASGTAGASFNIVARAVNDKLLINSELGREGFGQTLSIFKPPA